MARDVQPSSAISSRRQPKGTRLVVLGIVLLSAALGSLYAMYVLNQMNYLAARNFRLLSAWSQQLSATLANYQRVFTSAHKACFQFNFLAFGPPTQAPPLSPSSSLPNTDPMSDCLDRISAALPSSLHPVKDREPEEPLPPHAYWIDIAPISSPTDPNVVLTYISAMPPGRPSPPSQPSRSLARPEDGVCRILSSSSGSRTLFCQAALSLRHLSDQLGIGQEEVFDEIVVADQMGTVHYQRGDSRFQFVSLRPWIRPASASESDHESAPSGRGAGNHAGSLAEQLPLHQEVDVGGMTYQVFAQPIVLPSSEDGRHVETRHSQHFIIAGFVKSDRFTQQAFAIPYTVLVLIAFLVLVLAVSLPFLKLQTMGANDRIRQADVITSMGACLLSTALLAFFLLDAFAYWHIKDQKDEELTTFAHELARNLSVEIGQAAQWMTTANQRIAMAHQHLCEHATLAIDDRSIDDQFFDRRPLRAHLLQDASSPFSAFLHTPYPDPIMIFWVDAEGDQRAKWTTRIRPTPLINVADREYVRQAKNHELWNIQGADLWIQPIYSKTMGEFSVMISTKTATPCPAFDQTYPVTAVQIRLSSVMEPIVPPGFGFAVLRDEDGTVLFHSKKWRALRENFLEETDHNPELESLVFSRTSGTVSGRYWGIGHRFHVMPLPDLPWTLVTFMTKDALRTFNFEVLVVSTSLFLCYGTIFLVLFLLIGLIWGAIKQGRTDWMWPRADYRERYHLIILINALLSIGFGVLFILEPSDWSGALFLSMVIPLFATTAMYVILTAPRNPFSGLVPALMGDYRRSYAVMVATMMIVFAFIPTLALFTIVHDAEIGLLVKHGQLGLARALVEREQRLRHFYRHIAIGVDQDGHGPDWQRLLDRRRGLDDSPTVGSSPQAPQDIYAGFLFQEDSRRRTVIQRRERERAPLPESTLDPVARAAHQLWFKARALFNPPSRETAGIILHRPHDPPFHWITPASNSVSLTYGDYRIVSPVPTLIPSLLRDLAEWHKWPMKTIFLTLLAGLVILALLGSASWFVLYRLPRFVADNVFLLSFDTPVEREAWQCLTVRSAQDRPRHLLVIGPPGSGKSRFVKAQGWRSIDFRAIKDDPYWLFRDPVASVLQHTAPQTIAIDHFEYGTGSYHCDLKKLALLEAALATGHRLCILSSIDPFASIGLNPRRDEPATLVDTNKQDDLAHRMAQLFQSFTVVYFAFQSWGYGRNVMGAENGPWRQALTRHAQATVEKEQEQLLRPYYHAIWTSCTDDEKLALFYLAKDRFLHAENPALRRLLCKGLAVLQPDLQLMSASFRRFVMATANDSQIVQLEQRSPGSFWQTVSWPLGIALLLLAAFLFVTQEQVRSAAGASLSLLPAILPVAIKLVGTLQKPKAGG
ncbi:MAG: hypothetical protein D6690_17145 [Nitrospirae bacterium]|nr:MAG: hypothetical protein D6690_17145 [Nitrospirota bacterium]